MSRISWIGLGSIGQVICKNLATYGPSEHPITIWNRTHQTAADLAAGTDKLKAVETISEAIRRSDIICLCLVDDAAVRSVVGTAIADSDIEGKLFADFSTIHPDTAEAVSGKLQSHGANYLASPIFGGVPLAVDRQITLVLAGSSDAIAKFAPFTDGVICKNTIILADEPCQQASLLKLIGNFIRFSTIEVLSEASVLSEKVGLAPETLSKFTELLIPGPATGQLEMLRSGSYHKAPKPAVPITMAVKENAHLNDLAQRSGAKLRTLDTITSHVDRLQESRGQNASLLAIYGKIREDCGLPFEN